MKKKIKYSNEPLGKIKIIKDFLPKPEALVFREEIVEIKVPLSRRSADFFQKHSKKQHVPVEQLLSALADSYAEKYE